MKPIKQYWSINLNNGVMWITSFNAVWRNVSEGWGRQQFMCLYAFRHTVSPFLLSFLPFPPPTPVSATPFDPEVHLTQDPSSSVSSPWSRTPPFTPLDGISPSRPPDSCVCICNHCHLFACINAHPDSPTLGQPTHSDRLCVCQVTSVQTHTA